MATQTHSAASDYKELFSEPEASSVLIVAKIILLDSVTQQSQGPRTCVITRAHLHLISDEREAHEEKVLQSVALEKIENILVSTLTGQLYLSTTDDNPKSIVIYTEKGNSLKDALNFAVTSDQDRVLYLLENVHRLAKARLSLQHLHLNTMYESSDSTRVCRLSESSYTELYEKIMEDLGNTSNILEASRSIEILAFTCANAPCFLRLCLKDPRLVKLSLECLEEIAPSVSRLLNTDNDDLWRSHRDALKERKDAKTRSESFKLNLNSAKKHNIMVIEEEAGLRVIYVGADPGQQEIKSGDLITKVGREKLGQKAKKQKVLDSAPAKTRVYFERNIPLSPNGQQDGDSQGLLRFEDVCRLRLASAVFAFVSQVAKGSLGEDPKLRLRSICLMVGGERERKSGRRTDDINIEDDIDRILKLMLVLNESAQRKTQESTDNLSSLAQRMRLRYGGDPSSSSPAATSEKKQRILSKFNSKDGKIVTPHDNEFFESLKDKDQEAFGIQVSRTAHMQAECLVNVVKLLLDPKIQAERRISRQSLTTKLSSIGAKSNDYDQLCRMLQHLSGLLIDVVKLPLMAARTSYFVNVYSAALSLLLSDELLRKEVGKRSISSLKLIVKSYNKLKKNRRRMALPELYFCRISIPLIDKLITLLS